MLTFRIPARWLQMIVSIILFCPESVTALVTMMKNNGNKDQKKREGKRLRSKKAR